MMLLQKFGTLLEKCRSQWKQIKAPIKVNEGPIKIFPRLLKRGKTN